MARSSVPAIRVKQWLKQWDNLDYSAELRRAKPQSHFYVFSIPAAHLRALSGVQRRIADDRRARASDTGIQRAHDRARSEEIGRFIHFGFPWSDLSETRKNSGEYDDLKKPGWLPTAIVTNILTQTDKRRGRGVDSADLVQVVESDGGIPKIVLPESFQDESWLPGGTHPIEIIDGQHRLWAFEENPIDGDFEVPVVAFHGLDLSWQAYLFYTINIKPKRINPSLAFDLYPLLRMEDWLDRFHGHAVYRESRAQELTEVLWSHPESPWRDRINMLGEKGLDRQMVSQASWIRALLATCVKASSGRRVSIGGLFGAPVGSDDEALSWNRAQQAAFLLAAWQAVEKALTKNTPGWTEELASHCQDSEAEQADCHPFTGRYTLLSTDQGVRGVLHTVNDFAALMADDLDLESWDAEDTREAIDEESVRAALTSLKRRKIWAFLKDMGDSLAEFDWRSSKAPGLDDASRLAKAAYRGSGGYKELRMALVRHVWRQGDGDLRATAAEIADRLGYEL